MRMYVRTIKTLLTSRFLKNLSIFRYRRNESILSEKNGGFNLTHLQCDCARDRFPIRTRDLTNRRGYFLSERLCRR